MALHKSNQSYSPEPASNITHTSEEIKPVIESMTGDVKDGASPPMPVPPEEKSVAKIVCNQTPITDHSDNQRYPSYNEHHPVDDTQHTPNSQQHLPIHQEPAPQPCIHIHYHECKFHQQYQYSDEEPIQSGYSFPLFDNQEQQHSQDIVNFSNQQPEDAGNSDEKNKDVPALTKTTPAGLGIQGLASVLAPVAETLVTTGIDLIVNDGDNIEEKPARRRRRSRRKHLPKHTTKISDDKTLQQPTRNIVTPSNLPAFPEAHNTPPNIPSTPSTPYTPSNVRWSPVAHSSPPNILSTPSTPYAQPNISSPGTAFTAPLPLSVPLTVPNIPVHYEENSNSTGRAVQSNNHIVRNIINDLGTIGGIPSTFSSSRSKKENKSNELEKPLFTLLSYVLNSLQTVIRRCHCNRNGSNFGSNYNQNYNCNASKPLSQHPCNFQSFNHHLQNCYGLISPSVHQQALTYCPFQSCHTVYQGFENVFLNGHNRKCSAGFYPHRQTRNCFSHQLPACGAQAGLSSTFNLQQLNCPEHHWSPPVQLPRYSMLPQLFPYGCLPFENQTCLSPLFHETQLYDQSQYCTPKIQKERNYVLPQLSQYENRSYESHASTNASSEGLNMNYFDQYKNNVTQDSRNAMLSQNYAYEHQPYCDHVDECYIFDSQQSDYQGQSYCSLIQLPNDFMCSNFPFDEDFSCYLEAGIHQHFHSYIIHQPPSHND